MADVPPSPVAHPLAGRVSFLLSQLGAHSAQRFTQRLARLGIRPSHFAVLVHLSQGEGRSQQQLAGVMGLHRNVMVGLVDELEQRGLIERRRHPADRRAHALHLTPAAYELLPRAEHAADEHEAELLAGIDQRDRERLLAVLQRLADQSGLQSGIHPGLTGQQNSTASQSC